MFREVSSQREKGHRGERWATSRIKLCGLRSAEDLSVAVAAGVDAVGVIHGTTHRTEDGLDLVAAEHLLRSVPNGTATVLVTHLSDPDTVLAAARRLNVDAIQLHGLPEEDAVREIYARREGKSVTRAIHVQGVTSVREAETFALTCDGIHLDTRTKERLGGTGKKHDWSLSATIAETLRDSGCPCILSGGLTPRNVRSAILRVRPYGVDLNSGVERSDGSKSAALLTNFVENARTVAVPRPFGQRDPIGRS